MTRLKPILGNVAAWLTLFGAFLIPFVLMNLFTRGVAATGVRVHPSYSGGDPVRTIQKPGYQVVVFQEIQKSAPLDRTEPYIQLKWTPADALPAQIADDVDLDGNGTPDLRARFAVPKDPQAELRVDVEPLTPKLAAMRNVAKPSFSCLIARVGNSIIVRVPLKTR